jgi:acyl-CoA thioester hydrolase
MHYEISIRPRVSETDMLGHINNVALMGWFEEGRSYMVREALGKPPRMPPFVLARMETDFRHQLFFGEEARVRTDVERLGNTSVIVRQRIEQGGRLCAEARCVLVHFNHETQRPSPLPERIRASLARFHAGGDIKEPGHTGQIPVL